MVGVVLRVGTGAVAVAGSAGSRVGSAGAGRPGSAALAEATEIAVGQLALVQPFFGLLLAAWLLQEPVGWDLVAVLTAVIGCVVGARRYA